MLDDMRESHLHFSLNLLTWHLIDSIEDDPIIRAEMENSIHLVVY